MYLFMVQKALGKARHLERIYWHMPAILNRECVRGEGGGVLARRVFERSGGPGAENF